MLAYFMIHQITNLTRGLHCSQMNPAHNVEKMTSVNQRYIKATKVIFIGTAIMLLLPIATIIKNATTGTGIKDYKKDVFLSGLSASLAIAGIFEVAYYGKSQNHAQARQAISSVLATLIIALLFVYQDNDFANSAWGNVNKFFITRNIVAIAAAAILTVQSLNYFGEPHSITLEEIRSWNVISKLRLNPERISEFKNRRTPTLTHLNCCLLGLITSYIKIRNGR
jgi:hypothetical protein